MAQSEGEGAVSEVYGVGKGVAARMRRVSGKVGLEPRLQVDLCSEAPGRPCCIWTEESESRAVVDRKRKGLGPAGRCTSFCLIPPGTDLKSFGCWVNKDFKSVVAEATARAKTRLV